MRSVFKVLTESEWKDLQSLGEFRGTPLDLKDGYIHLCTKEQYPGVIERYFEGLRPLFVLEFDGDKFLKALVMEPSTNGELFPHLYGQALKYKEVIRVITLD